MTRGFAVSVVALSTILAFSATGRVDMTVRIATALLLLARWSLWSQSRPGTGLAERANTQKGQRQLAVQYCLSRKQYFLRQRSGAAGLVAP